MKSSTIILVFLLILGTGCMSTPVNNTNIVESGKRVPFNYPVLLYVWNENNQWQKIAAFTSSDQGSEDKENAGLFWYLWQGEVSIPRTTWKLNTGPGPNLKATLIAMYGRTPVEIMKEDFKTCLQENKGTGIATIRNACKSDTSPHLTLYAYCQNGSVDCEQLYINAHCQGKRLTCDKEYEDATDSDEKIICGERYVRCLQDCDVEYSGCMFEGRMTDDVCEDDKLTCERNKAHYKAHYPHH